MRDLTLAPDSIKPGRLFDGADALTPPLADTLADLLAMAAAHCTDREARGLLLDATARTFDASSRLRRLADCGRIARAAA